jgi:hypothetical protein
MVVIYVEPVLILLPTDRALAALNLDEEFEIVDSEAISALEVLILISPNLCWPAL